MGAQGTVEVDFGAFPGKSDVAQAVAQAAIGAGNLVEAWLWPIATTDHTADEHIVESIRVFAHSVVAGVGFTITARNDNPINEPLEYIAGKGNTTLAGALVVPSKLQHPTAGGMGTRIYGKWRVAWCWN